MKRQIFVQSELLLQMSPLLLWNMTARRTSSEQRPRKLLPHVEDQIHAYIENEDDERALEKPLRFPEGLRVHLHRLKGIDVIVRYAGRDVRRTFRPSTTVARVKKWATHELGISASDAAELMLQVTGTDNRPDGDTHIGALVKAPAKNVSFDLVPSPRVNG